MEAGRFAVLSEEAATDLLLTKDAANTKKANLRAYRTFRSSLNDTVNVNPANNLAPQSTMPAMYNCQVTINNYFTAPGPNVQGAK